MVAVLIVASCALFAVSAAEVAETQAAADDTSAASEASSKIYFQVPDNWNNVTQMWAHVYMSISDGVTKWPTWKTRSEKMTDEGNGLWSYDVKAQTGNTLDPAKGAAYTVLFVNNNDMQTYNLIFGADCLGDTAIVTGNTFENPADSNKTCIEAVWKSGKYGPEKVILSTGNDVVGKQLPEGSSDAEIMASWLQSYYGDATKTPNVPSLLKKLNVTGQQVYDALVPLVQKDSSKTDDEKNELLNTAAGLLGVEIKDKENPGSSVSSGSSNGGSSNGGSSNSGSSNSGSNGTTSNGGSNGGSTSTDGNDTVSSGQDSTIVFVLGGFMFAAAAVLFVTRKREN